MTQERTAVSIPVNGHENEPIDSFSARDVEILVTALRLYHDDLMDVRQVTDCMYVQHLCERIVRPGRRWVAREEGE